MDSKISDKAASVKIGDKIRLVRAADHNTGVKLGEIGTIEDTSMSKVVDFEGLRLVMWIRWESGKESAIIEGMDLFDIV